MPCIFARVFILMIVVMNLSQLLIQRHDHQVKVIVLHA